MKYPEMTLTSTSAEFAQWLTPQFSYPPFSVLISESGKKEKGKSTNLFQFQIIYIISSTIKEPCSLTDYKEILDKNKRNIYGKEKVLN